MWEKKKKDRVESSYLNITENCWQHVQRKIINEKYLRNRILFICVFHRRLVALVMGWITKVHVVNFIGKIPAFPWAIPQWARRFVVFRTLLSPESHWRGFSWNQRTSSVRTSNPGLQQRCGRGRGETRESRAETCVLVDYYATLQPAMSARQSVGWSVSHR